MLWTIFFIDSDHTPPQQWSTPLVTFPFLTKPKKILSFKGEVHSKPRRAIQGSFQTVLDDYRVILYQ